jgi:hypothetical protein
VIPDLKPGERVLLNANAREFFSEKIVVVDEVKSWGIVCSIPTKEGAYWYRASWDQVDGRAA